MTYQIITAVEPEYIRVTASGENYKKEVFGFLDRVKEESEKAGKKRVLIDSLNFAEQMSDAERFHIGQKFSEIFGSRIKTAMLFPAEFTTRMGELAAINRGARLRVTECETDALEWLLAD